MDTQGQENEEQYLET